MFTRREFDEALWIATAFNAHKILEDLYERANKRPKRAVITALAFLVGMILTCDEYGNVKIRKIARVLGSLPAEFRAELGIDKVDEKALYRYSTKLTRALDYSPERAPLIPEEERRWRRDQLIRVSDALLQATLIPRPEGSVDYAIDSTGVWSNALGDAQKGSSSDSDLDEDHIRSEVQAESRAAEGEDTTLSEASWGYKTRKRGGSQMFFGYDVHALIRVSPPAQEQAPRPEPNLVEAISVVAAGTDIVAPALSVIDRVLESGQEFRYLFADRHYSYKKANRWRLPLNERGIKPIFDMHQQDQGFRLHEQVPWAAGHPHCPRVPQHLGNIPTLSPSASPEQVAHFRERIEERMQYAAKILSPLNDEGKVRFQCPALDNKIGCEIRLGTVTMAKELGLPVVENPPSGDNAPKICCQKSMLLDIHDPESLGVLKNHQNPIWGSQEWRRLYSRRTFIEGWFGTIKDTVGLKRRSIRVNGIAMNFLSISVYSALTNRRHLRRWHLETGLGDTNHRLLQRFTLGQAKAA